MDTREQLYWIALIALVILGPIGFLLWRRTIRQLAMMDSREPTTERTPVAKQPALAQEFQAQQPTAGARKAIRLAPLEEVVRQLLQKAPHIGVIGKTRDGKTTTGEAIIRLLRGEAFVVDSKWWRGKWGGLAAAGIDDNAGYSQIATGLKDVFSEFTRRLLHKRDHSEATFTGLWLIWDEINDTMEEVPNAGIPLRWLLRVGHECNVHVLFFSQSDRVGALGLEGHGDAVDNVLWIYLGANARKVVNRLACAKKIDAVTEQQLLALPRPAVVGHGGQFYAVDLSNAVPLSQGPLTTLTSWTAPVPSSEEKEKPESMLGTPELPAAKPSPKLPATYEAAVRYWIAQGLKDTPIAMKLDMRTADALEYVREVRAKLVQEEQQNVV